MRNTIGTFSLIITTLAGVALYSQKVNAADPNPVMVSYGKKQLTGADLEAIAMEMFDGKLPEGKSHVSDLPTQMQELIARQIVIGDLLDQEAKKMKIEDTASFKKLLDRSKQQLVHRELLRKILSKDINDKTLKQRYVKFTRDFGKPQELRLQQILVDNEDAAKKLLAEVTGGKKFDEVAKTSSMDPSSKAQGGDLGFVQKEQLVKPLADAAFEMKDGEVSQPVKTDFGWHIIKVVERRDVKVPAFEQVKQHLEQQMSQELFEAYVDKLLKTAKFKLTMPEAVAEEKK